MKKHIITLFLIFASVVNLHAAITYELNGGVTNDYGWMSKNDMFQSCMADAGVTGLPSLAELKEQADPFLPIATPFVTERCQAILDNAKWDWLEAYIMSVQNADVKALPLTEGAASVGWRYAIAAFFLEMQHASWPKSADFSRAGKYEAFQPAWKHGFANPTEPTSDWVLNAPYKEGYTFAGWYPTPDFSGNKVTTINTSTTGTLYAKWRDYTPTIAEVKALAVNTQTKLSGVVTFIDGKNVYIQDITGGILLSMAANPTFTVSQSVIVQGTKGLYGGAPQLQGCVEVSAEPGTMPDPIVFEDLNELINDTELKYCAQLVKVSGLTITEYDNYNNPTFFDGIRSAKGDNMVLDPTVFPIGSRVVVTAIADYYNGFRFVGDPAGVEYTSPAKKDSYTYPVRNDKYALTNNWVISNNEDNFAVNKPGNTDVVRGMAAKDGIMYFINRETESLVRVDAATGIMLAPLKITGDHLFQVQGEDGTYTDAVTYKFNDLKFDNAGNCLIGAIVMAGNKCQPFIVYSVNLETGVATELINDVLWDNPDIDGIQFRFDAFGVYGDVTKNAVVMAADQSSWNVFRWQIKNGVVGKGELISIELDPERDNYLASTATGFGTAPQIAPQDEEGTLFYVDGFSTLPMLFDEDGTLIDDFINCPHGTIVQNNEGETTTLNAGLNGLQEFQVGEEYFLIMVATHTVSNPPAAFALYKFADEMRTFDGLEPLWYFPHNGLGSATIGFRAAVPSVEVNGNTATISIYAVNNGYASYTLTVDDSDAPIRTEETATACDSYTWNGKTYTQSGTYTYTTTAANGNDSIVTLHLTISPILYTEETISACDSCTWNGQTYTEDGIYTYITTSVAGCDSIVTLHLTINQSEMGATESVTICHGETYTWNGRTYSTAGEYSITLSNINGCDSVVTLQLTILPEMLTTEEYVAICHGETYTWNGQDYATEGAYTANLSSVLGCDSTAILHLTVLPEVIRKTEYISAPTNKTVTWRGKEYNETGIYYDTVHFVVNPLCDSVIYMLDLTIADNIDSDKYCGDNLTWYYSNGALIITGSGAMYDDPDRLTYRDESWYPARVNNIVLPEAITHIGSVAFADCVNLTNIVIPNKVTSIGDGAFSWTGLQAITIPASVTDLGEQVFEACNGLHTVLYESEPRSINNQTIHPFIGCVHLDTIIAPAALWHCTTADPALEARYGVPHKARYIEVTDGELTNQAIKYIANNSGAMEILDLTNATNTTLPYGAWSNSYQLFTLYLPQQLEVIPESMVEGARNLSEIAIPATVTEIGNYAFAGCVNVWHMTIDAVIPPKVYENTFDGISRSISVQVPAGSEELYREAAYWREFFIEPTNNLSPISNCQKLLREDQILILRNGKVYTTMGQLVNTEE